jgi:hypothetical protein
MFLAESSQGGTTGLEIIVTSGFSLFFVNIYLPVLAATSKEFRGEDVSESYKMVTIRKKEGTISPPEES